MAAPSKPIYVAQWYESEESLASPYALTPDESKWKSHPEPTHDLQVAKKRCKNWQHPGSYQSSRIVELDPETGQPISVVWASAWEAPIAEQGEQGASGVPGYACKLMVWMEREKGDPSHWGWRERFEKYFASTNGWDLMYGREVDNRGKMALYSIKLNLYPVEKKHPSKWNWWKILDKDIETQRDDIEFVRAVDIEPREFPAGVELSDCAWCGKTHAKSTSWQGYNPDSGDMEPHCSCFCIDERWDTDHYREDPNGEEFEEPGCEQVREGKIVISA